MGAAWALTGALPLVGLVSLLLFRKIDPNWDNHRLHFVLFLGVAGLDFALGYSTGAAARKRGDARVFLVSLAFLATGGFLALHAVATPGVLLNSEIAGFKIAVPIGLLFGAIFAAASAFVDLRPDVGPVLVRHQAAIRRVLLGVVVVYAVVALAQLPPLNHAGGEAASGSPLSALAGVGAATYALSASRYVAVYRERRGLLPASMIAAFMLLAEAMIGVAVTGERSWHASWWEWHGLLLLAYGLVAYAARREWHDERFRQLYLSGTREHAGDVSVLFGDLAGFTPFTERSAPADVAAMLNAYFAIAAPLLSSGHGAEVEKFMGDGIMATFNTRGDQPDHAVRAAHAALHLQQEITRVADRHPAWPRLRVGVNTGEAVVREMGGQGHVVYAVVGDTVNLGARLEGQAPVDGVLVGAETYRRLPDGTVVEPVTGLRVKGKEHAVDAYVLRSLPLSSAGSARAGRHRARPAARP